MLDSSPHVLVYNYVADRLIHTYCLMPRDRSEGVQPTPLI
jgi:hypothetical protein